MKINKFKNIFLDRDGIVNDVILRDGIDCKRIVNLKDDTSKMSLVTAIARPARLDEYLPEVVSKNYFEDHHTFIKSEIEDSKKLFKKNNWPIIDVTRKSVEETAASILKIIEIKKHK